MAEEVNQLKEANEVENTSVVEWTFGPDADGNTRTYKQTKLSFIKKFRFFGLLGGVIRSAIGTSGTGVVSDLMGSAGSLRERAEQFGSTNVDDAEQLLNLVSSILIYVPDFLEQSYCELLSIPYEERPWAQIMMEKSGEDGGLSDEDGIAIINTFIVQNWDELRDFFGKHLRTVVETAQNQMQTTENQETEEESPLPKPSNTTLPSTGVTPSTVS